MNIGPGQSRFQAWFGLTPAQFYARFASARPEFQRIVTGATVAEADEPDREGIWLSTPLYPGLNLIGWVEDPTPVTELFAAIPRLEIAYSYDATSRKWSAAWRRGGNLGGLSALKPGMGVWLRVSDGAPMHWERRVAPGSTRDTTLTLFSQLGVGHNFVAMGRIGQSFGPFDSDLLQV